MADQQYVVVPVEMWEAMLTALQLGLADEALGTACVAPLAGEYRVVHEHDVLAPQALYSYAANIRTAVEFTESNGLCVMTDDTRTSLTDMADELVDTAMHWQERQQQAGATVQPADYGIMEP